MKIAIFSDIHGNLEALEAVGQDIELHGCDLRYCLGDCVGYGANPCECVEHLWSQRIPTVKGNHDQEASINGPLDDYDKVAATAIEWTRTQLKISHRNWLARLPYKLELPQYGITLCHASGYKPERYDYIVNPNQAYPTLLDQNTPALFIGHTHVPAIFLLNRQRQVEQISVGDDPVLLASDNFYLINVGSLGQPRDRDPRACYVIYDLELKTVTFRRVPYSIEKTQEKLRITNLPEILAMRLSVGI